MTNDFLYRSIPAALSLEKLHTFGILHTIQPVGIIPGAFLINEVFIMSRGTVKCSAYHKVVSNVHFQFPFRPVACRVSLECSFLFTIISYYQELEKSSTILKLLKKILKLWQLQRLLLGLVEILTKGKEEFLQCG